MLEVSLRHESAEHFDAYAAVSIAFAVGSVLVPVPELDSMTFREEPCRNPREKDYDSVPGGHPTAWPGRFDTSRWHVVSARRGDRRVGGMVLIQGQPAVDMLEGRDDLALIWDQRVAPPARGTGIGARLIAEAVRWSRSMGCSELKVESQNVNVPACRFYERMGFELRAANPLAYPEHPDEIQMLWYKCCV